MVEVARRTAFLPELPGQLSGAVRVRAAAIRSVCGLRGAGRCRGPGRAESSRSRVAGPFRYGDDSGLTVALRPRDAGGRALNAEPRSEEHTSELQSRPY